METMQLIVACMVILVGAALVLVTYKKTHGHALTLDDLVVKYKQPLVDALKEAVNVLEVRLPNFDTITEYYNSIVNQAIKFIMENPESIGIPKGIFTYINTELIEEKLKQILNEAKLEIFSVITPHVISANSALFDEETLQVLCAAVDTGDSEGVEITPVQNPADPTDEDYNKLIGDGPSVPTNQSDNNTEGEEA